MLDFLQLSLEHAKPCIKLRERNVNSALKSSSDGKVESFREIGGSQDENSILIITHTLHLSKKLRFYSFCGFIFVFGPTAAEGIDLVNEND
jgi:hypothetical protein